MDLHLKKVVKTIWREIQQLQHLIWLYRLLKAVGPYTLVDPSRLIVLYGLAREAVRRNGGDIVECGTYNGGSAAVLGAAIRDYPNCRLLLHDTFEGLPSPGARDGALAQEFKGNFKGSIEAVTEVLRKVGFPIERAVIRKGLFKDTFKEPYTERVAVLHIDADWYDSTLYALETFYPLIPQGGIVILDDFGHWEGTREAVYDYCHTQGIKPLIERVGPWQAFWRKGQEHNRSICYKYTRGIYWPQLLETRRLLSLMRWIVWPVRD